MKEKEAKAILNFHNAEVNSYVSLFTSGLKKPEKDDEKMSDKEFENKLVESFRHVNKDVLQVNVYPSFNNTYVGRIYLKNENAGKAFIVDYTYKRDFLYDYYKDKNNIRFNINVDSKTFKKIKTMEKKVGEIIGNIKN